MSYKELRIKEIENWLGLKKNQIPKHLILYASWPWPLVKRLREVKRYLKNPKLGTKTLGNYWIGEINGKKVGFMLVYGHGMAADMLYLMIQMGVRYIYQIGSIGALQKTTNLFDLIIPEKTIKFEGLSHLFYKEKFAECDKSLLDITKEILKEKNFINYHIGKTISVDFLFAETKERIKSWSNKKFLGVDMESATTYAMAKMFGIKSIAILRVVDSLVKKGKLLSDLEKNKNWGAKNEKLKKFVKEIISEIIERVEKYKI